MAVSFIAFVMLSLICWNTNASLNQIVSTNGTYIALESYSHSSAVTFYEAERLCQSETGTHLASIHSKQQQEEIYDVMIKAYNSNADYAWIGLSDEILDGHMIWTDGTTFDYSNEILSSGTNTHCWRLRRSANIWYNTACDQASGQIYVVCNANPSWSQPIDYSFLPPIQAIGISLDARYTLYNHSATFVEADAYCQRMLGTHLVSITNDDESEMVQELCSRTETDTLCWIGLTEMFTNGYEWTDGNDIGYYRWKQEAVLSSSCVAVTSNGDDSIYSWNTNDCNDITQKTVFVCSSYAPTPYPTKIPTKSPITAEPTLYPSVAPTLSPYEMIQVEGSYLCSELSDRTDIFYGITYIQCMNECKSQYENSCKMINYRADTTPSRCYLFDAQCTLNSDNTGNSKVAFVEYKKFCVDLNWNDKEGDTCYAYSDILGYCNNGNVTDSSWILEIEGKGTNINAMEACCECGGGTVLIDDVTMTFEQITETQSDTLCEWKNNGAANQQYKTWDNIMIYKLCQTLKDKTNAVDIDCNSLIDKSWNNNVNFISCDFNDFSQIDDDLYFLFIISNNNITKSMEVYINSDWFQLTSSLLSNTISSSSYTQCISSLWSQTNNKFYVATPCDADIDIQTTTSSTTSTTTTSTTTTSTTTTSTTTTSRPPSSAPTTKIVLPQTTLIMVTDDVKHSKTTEIYPTKYNQTYRDDQDTKTTSTTQEIQSGVDSKSNEESLATIQLILIFVLIVLILMIIAMIIFVIIYCNQNKRKNSNGYQMGDIQKLNVEITKIDGVIGGDTPSTDDEKPINMKEWVKLQTDDGRVYYQNNITKKTQWTVPMTTK